jgi:hypothetical protein
MTQKRRLAALAAVLCGVVLLFAADTMIVKVKVTKLKNNPQFFASTVVSLDAGAQLEKIETQGSWIKVKTSQGAVGWLHSSAVQSKKFSLLAVNAPNKTGASADEVALAGKGFNKQVEESFKSKNKDIDFRWVDRMLKITIGEKALLEFLKAGRLADYGGPQ